MHERRPHRITFLHWIVIVSIVTAALLAFGVWQLSSLLAGQFPDVTRLRNEFPLVHYQGPKKPFRVSLSKSPPPGWTSFGELPKHVVGAVLVNEDASFFSHKGYDPEALKLAVQEDLAAGRFARGASTITMQVVKNVFLSQEKTLSRKIREFILAIRLDERVSKRKILETYFNIAEWGEGIFGIRRAAAFYFQKSPSELTPKEAAFLAMLLPSPKRYSQSFRSKQLSRYARRTIDTTLLRLAKGRYMPEELLESEQNTPLSFEVSTSAPPPEEPPEEESSPEEDSTPHLMEADSSEASPTSEAPLSEPAPAETSDDGSSTAEG